MDRVFIFITSFLIFIGAHKLAAQKPQRENGVIVKVGVTQTIFNRELSKTFADARPGYLIGFDGVFHDDLIIFQPGIYGVFHTDGYGEIFSQFDHFRDKLNSVHNWNLQFPMRIGFNVINAKGFRIKILGGVHAIYSPEGIDLSSEGYSRQLRYVNVGWNGNVSIILLPFSIDLDYGSTFNKFKSDGPLYGRYLALNLGIVF